MIRKMKNVRPLRADEIECRVGLQNATGCSLLLYKDARCDMRILDETVGVENWTREHHMVGDELYCKVGIYDTQRDVWVYKEDVGVESKTESVKGRASDAFKRACFTWGIGRALYTAPFIWINFAEGDTFDKDGKKVVKMGRFSVADIQYKDGNITYLAIRDSSGNGRYTYGKKAGRTMTEALNAIRGCRSIDELMKVQMEFCDKAGDRVFDAAFNERYEELEGR